MKANEYTAISLLKQMGYHSLVRDEEAINAVITGILEANWKYKPDKSSLKTFRINSARFKILSLLKSRKKRRQYERARPVEQSYSAPAYLKLFLEEAPLTDIEKIVLQRIYSHGNSIADTAIELNVTTNAIHKHIDAAVKKLQQYCAENDIYEL
jgi:DNA-directed RNA polymerase specialized sigma24 family protein